MLQEVVRTIRNLRTEKKVPLGKRIAAEVVAGERASILQEQAATLAALAWLDAAHLQIVGARPENPQALAQQC